MIELEFYLPGNHAQEMSEYLLELGALAITLRDAQDNPIFEPEPNTLPLWPDVKLSALIATEAVLEEILLHLYTQEKTSLHGLQKKIIPEEDWVRKTQSLTQPQCFADKLWIYPSWHSAPDDDAVKVLLDPGLAFGTGAHATTALMLEWLANNPPADLSVIDYGCGSGILAIACAKLGARSVYCTDIDPQALTATRENALINHVELFFSLPENLKVDLILANILAEPLIKLHDRFVDYLKPGGLLVISGILQTQVSMLTNAYQNEFFIIDVNTRGEWSSIAMRLL